MRKRLTPKQERFVKETVKTLNPTKAALAVYEVGSRGGDKYPVARAIASENLTKPLIRKRFEECLNEIDDEEVIGVIKEILHSGDARARLQAADMAMKLKDRYPAQKQQWQGQLESLGRYYVEESERSE